MLIWHQGHGIFLEGCWSSVSVGNLKKLILILVKESSAATTGEMDLSDSECQMGKNILRKACPLPGPVPEVWFSHIHQSSQNSSHRYAHEPTQGKKSLTESFPRWFLVESSWQSNLSPSQDSLRFVGGLLVQPPKCLDYTYLHVQVSS